MESLDVSIVIVSMNNLMMLFPCLESIINYTEKASYEIIVVAYLFSHENLKLLEERYPKVKIIESNEIRGFAENNNLGLKKITGTYCLILNDDIIFKNNVIDNFINTYNTNNEADFLSPIILYPGGVIKGRPPATATKYILNKLFRISYIGKQNFKYVNQEGIFQTYNISGCCFIVKTTVIEELGLFNETYFFCPEDIELSTKANIKGYKCFVDSTAIIYHNHMSTLKETSTATYPAMVKGEILFYDKYSRWPRIVLEILTFIGILKYLLFWILRNNDLSEIKKRTYYNTLKSIFTNKTPKEVFIQFYNKRNK